MKRYLRWGLVALALFVLAAPALAVERFWANVTDEYGTKITSGVQAHVYTAGTRTLATIYGDAKLTAKSNPVTVAQFATDQMVSFWGTASSYDVFVTSDDGDQAILDGFTATGSHRVVLPVHQGPVKKLTIPWSFVCPAGANCGATNTPTGFTIPPKSLVRDVVVETVNPMGLGTEAINVGLRYGETDGFIAAMSINSAGVLPGATNSGNYYGVLLVGADQSGSRVRIPHFVDYDTPDEVYYENIYDGGTGDGYIHVFFERLR